MKIVIDKFYGIWLIVAVVTAVAVGILVRGFDISGQLAFYTLPITAPAIVLAVTMGQLRVKRGGEKASMTDYLIPGVVALHSVVLLKDSKR